jgi:hypothetical protein
MILSGPFLISLFIQIRDLVLNMDPAYMDLFKIFAGSIGWIGSLTLYMWIREKRKQAKLVYLRSRR